MKPVSSRFRINFSTSTFVEKLKYDFTIARHKFEFIDLRDLFSVANAYANLDLPEYSTDYNLSHTQSVTKVKLLFNIFAKPYYVLIKNIPF